MSKGDILDCLESHCLDFHFLLSISHPHMPTPPTKQREAPVLVLAHDLFKGREGPSLFSIALCMCMCAYVSSQAPVGVHTCLLMWYFFNLSALSLSCSMWDLSVVACGI